MLRKKEEGAREVQASDIVDAVIGGAIGAFGRFLVGGMGPPPPPNRSALKQNPKQQQLYIRVIQCMTKPVAV